MSISMQADCGELCREFLEEHGVLPEEILVDDARVAEWEAGIRELRAREQLLGTEYQGMIDYNGEVVAWYRSFIYERKRIPITYGYDRFCASGYNPQVKQFAVGVDVVNDGFIEL